jgi:hypothetical protein
MSKDSLARGEAKATFQVCGKQITDAEYDLRVGRITQKQYDRITAGK